MHTFFIYYTYMCRGFERGTQGTISMAAGPWEEGIPEQGLETVDAPVRVKKERKKR
jgi:hypothetical protein